MITLSNGNIKYFVLFSIHGQIILQFFMFCAGSTGTMCYVCVYVYVLCVYVVKSLALSIYFVTVLQFSSLFLTCFACSDSEMTSCTCRLYLDGKTCTICVGKDIKIVR